MGTDLIIEMVGSVPTKSGPRYPAATIDTIGASAGWDRSTMPITVITEKDEVERMSVDLTVAAMAGTLTIHELVAAVQSLDRFNTDYAIDSIGVRWIIDYTELFMTCFSDDLYDTVSSLNLLSGSRAVAWLLTSTRLLQTLSPTERKDFVHVVYLSYGSPTDLWIRVCLEAGIERAFLGGLVIKRLRLFNPGSHDATYFESFLEGSGRISYRPFMPLTLLDTEYTVWSLLSDQQLIEAVEIIIGRLPELFFDKPDVVVTLGDRLRVRLTEEQWQALARQALPGVTDTRSMNTSELERIPLILRAPTFRANPKIKLSPGTIIEIALQHHASEAKPFFDALIQRVEPDYRYRVAYDDLRKQLDAASDTSFDSVARHIDRHLRAKIAALGWLNGPVVCRSVYSRRFKRTVDQFEVRIGDVIYVQSNRRRYETGPQITAGDWVAFLPASGSSLVNRPNKQVMAVHFSPFLPPLG